MRDEEIDSVRQWKFTAEMLLCEVSIGMNEIAVLRCDYPLKEPHFLVVARFS